MNSIGAPCDFLTMSCPKSSSNNDNQNVGAIVGGVIGGFFLLIFFIAAIAIVAIILHKQSMGKYTQKPSEPVLVIPDVPPPRGDERSLDLIHLAVLNEANAPRKNPIETDPNEKVHYTTLIIPPQQA